MSRILANENEIRYAASEYEKLFGDPAQIPVRFTLGGRKYRGFGENFTVEREPLPAGTQVATEFDGLRSYRSLSDYGEKLTARHPSGMTVIVKTAVYKAYGTFEWAVTFRNDADSNSPILSDILAADLVYEGKDPYLQHFLGDAAGDAHAMMPQETLLRRGTAVEFQPVGGRPTNFRLPFYRLSAGEWSTVISVGWSGQWKARFDALSGADSVHFTAGQATFDAYLLPGEEIRTPMMTLLFANCRADVQDGEMRLINLWRRFLIDCNLRQVNGGLMPPCAAGSTAWIYHEMRDSTDANQIQALDVYRENGISLDYWWMDAGWYFKGENERITSWAETGSWKMDTDRFPSEMKAISDHAASLGTRTLLWFEPERVTPNTFLSGKTEWCHTPQLADMGNPEFREWLQERVFKVLERGGMSLYRQDFNIDPLEHWQAADAKHGPDRNGISENHHVTGYLTYWDAIIARFPEMMIDSCASGGRRNDLETMRRSVSIHKTDADYSDFTRKQAMHLSFFQWLPYFGTLVVGPAFEGNPDAYAFRSAQIPWQALTYDVRKEPGENNFAFAAEMLRQWRETNMFLYGDYYPLTEWSNNETTWIGWEFCDEEKGGGIVQLYRRSANEEPERTFSLFGVEESRNYLVHDYNDGSSTVVSGRELMKNGLTVKLPDPRSAALIKFTVCD